MRAKILTVLGVAVLRGVRGDQMKKLLCLALVLLFLGVGTMRADQIFVCTGCTTPPGGDPNLINPASINVGFAGNHTSVSPLLIIVGVPNSGPKPTISTTFTLGSTLVYGLTAFTGTLTSGNNAYSALGLPTGGGGGSSESFVNWSGFDTANGFTVGSAFNLYVFELNVALNSGMGGNSPINIDFSGINAGSFVIAFNCAEAGSTCASGDIGATPFTNAGVVVPEPGTLALFGTGLLSVAAAIRRRLRG